MWDCGDEEGEEKDEEVVEKHHDVDACFLDERWVACQRLWVIVSVLN